MARTRTFIVGAVLVSLLLLSGCKKKKPPVPAPQAQAPTIESTVPATIPEVTPAQPEPEPAKPSPVVSKPHTTKKSPPSKAAKKTTPPADQTPNKIIVEEGKADPAPPPLTADTSHDQSARQQNTVQLLTAAEYNIRSITRTLSNDEQAVVQHIRGYIEQSKQATKEGDTERAYNLALKAHMMSDSLKK